MKTAGYSLVEVLLATVIIGIGMTAAAVLVSGIMRQSEVNQVSLRAANLQEQAVMLYRLGLAPGSIRSLLPEVCNDASEPPAGTFSVTFAASDSPVEIITQGVTNELGSNACTIIFADVASAAQQPEYQSNAATVLVSTNWP